MHRSSCHGAQYILEIAKELAFDKANNLVDDALAFAIKLDRTLGKQ